MSYIDQSPPALFTILNEFSRAANNRRDVRMVARRQEVIRMIDIYDEVLIDLRDACREPPFRNARTGKPAHISSVYRHVLRGARAVDGQRVRLEVVKTPSGLRTSREAINGLITKLTNPTPMTPEVSPGTATRRRQVEQAERELREAGLLLDTGTDNVVEASPEARP